MPSRADLEAWQGHLEANGVVRPERADKPLTLSPIIDAHYASVLVFRDPDNIQLELFAPRCPDRHVRPQPPAPPSATALKRSGTVEAKVAELVERGAGVQHRTRHDDAQDPVYYVVMHDPEWNEFCTS